MACLMCVHGDRGVRGSEVRACEAAAPREVQRLFQELAKGKGFVSPSDFASFLSLSGHPQSDVDQIVAPFLASEPDSQSIDLPAFLAFLLDPRFNSPLLIPHQPVQDMSAPLSHYYIYAGHNSYLTGNQLTSRSSVRPIASALQAGCRVIELDCWERKGRIQVLHGNTLTKAVQFEDCLKAIKENAFKATDYPVIITIENHLSPSLQKKAAKMIRETFGDTLYVPDPQERRPKEFLSPENLRGKILISDAPFRDPLGKQVSDDPEAAVEAIPDIMTGQMVLEEPDSPPLSPRSLQYKVKKELTKQLGAAANAAIIRKPPQELGKQEPHDEILEELIYISCEKPSEMKESAVNGQLVSGERAIMANLSEPQLRKYIKKDCQSIMEFTKKNLGRMYPFGLRFDSSNADPFLAWAHGVQLAATNIQGQDRPCWLNEAFFSINGSCGYVKKPNILLPNSEIEYQKMEKIPPKLTLKVKVLMGLGWHKLFDIFKKPDFYVKLALHGMPIDKMKKKTKIAHKTMLPNWEDEEFTFDIRVPEIAVLRFEVWEYDRTEWNDFVGQACFPILALKSGIHIVALRSRKGISRGSKILCSFQLSQPI